MEFQIVGAIKIKDGLFLGDQFAAQDLEFIVSNQVSRIINCAAQQIPNHWETIGVAYLNYGWMDVETQTIFDPRDQVLNTTYKFIQETINVGESVLVHSVRGHNRSVCVIAGYMMKKFRWTLYKTIEFLQSRRQDLEIKTCFFNQLLHLENRLVKIGLGAQSYNWKELNDDIQNNVDSEELLLTNTFLNSKAKDSAHWEQQAEKMLKQGEELKNKVVETKIQWATPIQTVINQNTKTFNQTFSNFNQNKPPSQVPYQKKVSAVTPIKKNEENGIQVIQSAPKRVQSAKQDQESMIKNEQYQTESGFDERNLVEQENNSNPKIMVKHSSQKDLKFGNNNQQQQQQPIKNFKIGQPVKIQNAQNSREDIKLQSKKTKYLYARKQYLNHSDSLNHIINQQFKQKYQTYEPINVDDFGDQRQIQVSQATKDIQNLIDANQVIKRPGTGDPNQKSNSLLMENGSAGRQQQDIEEIYSSNTYSKFGFPNYDTGNKNQQKLITNTTNKFYQPQVNNFTESSSNQKQFLLIQTNLQFYQTQIQRKINGNQSDFNFSLQGTAFSNQPEGKRVQFEDNQQKTSQENNFSGFKNGRPSTAPLKNKDQEIQNQNRQQKDLPPRGAQMSDFQSSSLRQGSMPPNNPNNNNYNEYDPKNFQMRSNSPGNYSNNYQETSNFQMKKF